MEHPNQPHIAIVPTPGMGHLIPLVQFAKRLVHHHNFAVTFLIPTDTTTPLQAHKTILQTLPTSVNSLFLPPVTFDDLPETVKIETRILLTLTRSLPALRDALKALTESTRLTALIVDLFGTDAFEVAKEFGVPSYVFFPTTAMVLSLTFELSKLDETTSCEYRDLPEPVKLPGCFPVHGIDLVEPVQDRKDDAYKRCLQVAKSYYLADGVLVNSFTEFEPLAFKALKEAGSGKPPIYPIGPLIQSGSSVVSSNGSECLSWLDKQPRGSVLYVSFGSGGTLSHDQIDELAFGLEMSKQRFLWVVKSPNEKAANAAYFSAKSNKDPLDFLPKGFLDRTKGLGLAVPSWAPQIEILSHGSTGGFLSHCGWNSSLESIVNGVPMISWPLFAEQKMNAVLLTEDLKVALRVQPDHKGIVGRDQIAKYVRNLFEGEEGRVMRNKMRDLKDAAAIALTPDGSSTKSLAEVAQVWKNQNDI